MRHSVVLYEPMKAGIPLILVFLIASCVGTPSVTPVKEPRNSSASGSAVSDVSEIQVRIVQAAQSLLGKKKLVFSEASFSSDCSGFILAAYYAGGIDLRKEFTQEEGNGVRRLYRIAERYEVLSLQKTPTLGDVVFWDNTYDANSDGKINDELTHAGIVTAIYQNGQVDYIHFHVRRGIVQESMNLRSPDALSLNAPMRIAEPGKMRPERWLAAQLYRSSGHLWMLRDRVAAAFQETGNRLVQY